MLKPWIKRKYFVEQLLGTASLGYEKGWEWYQKAEKSEPLEMEAKEYLEECRQYLDHFGIEFTITETDGMLVSHYEE